MEQQPVDWRKFNLGRVGANTLWQSPFIELLRSFVIDMMVIVCLNPLSPTFFTQYMDSCLLMWSETRDVNVGVIGGGVPFLQRLNLFLHPIPPTTEIKNEITSKKIIVKMIFSLILTHHVNNVLWLKNTGNFVV